MKRELDHKGPVSPSKDSLRHLEIRALVLCPGWTPSPSEPDFSLWKTRMVLGMMVKALRFSPCAKQKSDPEGLESLCIKVFISFEDSLSVLEVLS